MKRGSWWPIGITGVLATTVAANIWVMRLANDDPSFAIEPNYYKKAVAWDTTLAEAKRSSMLGWHLTPMVEPITPVGSARLRVTLTDSTGAPISGAAVHVSALHVAHANDIHEATLAQTPDGDYVAQIGATRPGQWELRFDVRVGAKQFTEVTRVDAVAEQRVP